MSTRYKQSNNFAGVTRFTKAPISEVEFSRMTADPTWLVPFNGGDITPVYYSEVLPHDTFDIDFEYIVRQLSASLRPTMGSLILDVFAFSVPNRVINESWKNVQGENTSGFWVAPEVELAPLLRNYSSSLPAPTSVQIPVGSVADLYGFPTQKPIHRTVLTQCNDLKFKGYLAIYNEYFRDQNYQPPIPFSKLNLYQGFLAPKGTEYYVTYNDETLSTSIVSESSPDGSSAGGSIIKAIFGEGGTNQSNVNVGRALTTFSALDKPLKANKLHDAFTSVLPAPQKGPEVTFNVAGDLPVEFSLTDTVKTLLPADGNTATGIELGGTGVITGQDYPLYLSALTSGYTGALGYGPGQGTNAEILPANVINKWNITATADASSLTGVSINELRTAIATQQVYEQLARTGSRYWSFLKGFFGVEVDDPFPDIPTQIGHYRAELDMYQVAQTSASQEGGSPQGSLTAFGYTTKGGAILKKTFIEHGYIHILAVVRHRNLYSTYFAPDNFRRLTMDFYLPQFANIGEQPVRKAVLNPFDPLSLESAIGFQEAWWEYRYEPDRVHGILRSGVEGSLDVWHFGDEYDESFSHVNGEWLVSNTQEVLDRTLAITSDLAPQFIGAFTYKVTKQRPMPVYSVPGIDTI